MQHLDCLLPYCQSGLCRCVTPTACLTDYTPTALAFDCRAAAEQQLKLALANKEAACARLQSEISRLRHTVTSLESQQHAEAGQVFELTSELNSQLAVSR